MSRDILITGGTGHTGRRLIRQLVERGESLRVLTRDPAKLHLDLRRKVRIVRAGLEDADAQEAFEGAAAVIACAPWWGGTCGSNT